MAKIIKRVLSVDMDYIVPKCIQLYNDLAGNDNLHEGDYWENIKHERECAEYIAYDPNRFDYIKALIEKNLGHINPENIFFGEEHDMILLLLCTREEQINEVFEVYNIDHHHDVYYGDESRSRVERFMLADLSNWVHYLGINHKIYKYYWLKNETSRDLDESIPETLNYIVDQETLIENPERLNSIRFDYIFVCRSSDYFPDDFWGLYEELRQLAEKKKGREYPMCTNSYCIDGKTRFIKGMEPR